MRKMMILFLVMFVALGVFAAATQAPQLDRVSGTIARSNQAKSTLIIKENRSNIERTVIYNDSTKWTKSKSPADMKEFKDGSRVVCVGHFNEKKELIATQIELSPPK